MYWRHLFREPAASIWSWRSGTSSGTRRKPVENLFAVPRSGKNLQKRLQYESGRHQFLADFDGADQFEPLVRRSRRVAPEG
jgi:hypothetical protein